MNKEDYKEIGHIGKPHGYKGQVNLNITGDDEIHFEKLTFVLLEVNSLLTPFFIEKIEINHKLLMKLENINSDSEARKLQSKKIFIPKEFVIVDQQSRDSEFLGYELIDKEKGSLGMVIRVEEMPASDVFIVIYKDKELILPINEDFITSINDVAKTINYEAPDGLIDLYLE